MTDSDAVPTAIDEEPANDVTPPQYAPGFNGMAIAPFSDAIRAILSRAVNPEDVEIRPNDGVAFLPGVWYRKLLTEAFGAGGWALAKRGPVRTRQSGGAELALYDGALFCLGRYVSEALGECTFYPGKKGMTYADAVEGARTSCIDRCCKDLGVAAELWDRAWREQWTARYATKDREGNWRKKSDPARLPVAPAVAVSPEQLQAQSFATRASTDSAVNSGTSATTTDAKSPALSPDVGYPASEAAVQGLRDLIKALQWKAQFAKDWFQTRFHVWPPQDMSAVEVETATALLTAWKAGSEAYNTAAILALGQGKIFGDAP